MSVRLYVGLTDHDWYTFLRERAPDEVNFWRPSSHHAFKALQPGEPFLFKAKAPHSEILGGGFFVRYVRTTVSLAWQAFGQNNGTEDVSGFLERVRHYRRGEVGPDPEVGAIILNEPFFFPDGLWVEGPPDWAPNIVSGKGYSTDEPIGKALWDAVVERIADPRTVIGPGVRLATSPLMEPGARYGEAYLTRSRLGQGAFRLGVLDAYESRCAVTGERVRPVLEAAHIKPFSLSGPNTVSNGLSLRSDIHKLFDLGYVTVDKDYKFRVSSRLDTEFNNGVDYYRLEGSDLVVVPTKVYERPDKLHLEWHNDVVFRP